MFGLSSWVKSTSFHAVEQIILPAKLRMSRKFVGVGNALEFLGIFNRKVVESCSELKVHVDTLIYLLILPCW